MPPEPASNCRPREITIVCRKTDTEFGLQTRDQQKNRLLEWFFCFLFFSLSFLPHSVPNPGKDPANDIAANESGDDADNSEAERWACYGFIDTDEVVGQAPVKKPLTQAKYQCQDPKEVTDGRNGAQGKRGLFFVDMHTYKN